MKNEKITLFTGTNIRELDCFPWSEIKDFKYIPNEIGVLQMALPDGQVLTKGNYLYRDVAGNYKVLITKKPISDLLYEYATDTFPKDFCFKITELI